MGATGEGDGCSPEPGLNEPRGLQGLHRDNGKENGSYYLGYIRIMEKKTETTTEGI